MVRFYLGICFSLFSLSTLAEHSQFQLRAVAKSLPTNITSQALHSFISSNSDSLQSGMSSGHFMNSSISTSEATVDGNPLFSDSFKSCVQQRSEIGLPSSFTVSEMIASVETIQQNKLTDECSRLMGVTFETAISFAVARDMGMLNSVASYAPVSESTVDCVSVVCSPFVGRPIFPLLNFAGRVLLAPAIIAGRAIVGAARLGAAIIRAPFALAANGINFRQGVRDARFGLGLDVGSVQSTPGFFNRVALRRERRQLGLGFFPGPRRLGLRASGFGRR